MKCCVFNTKPYDSGFLNALNSGFGHDLIFLESHLGPRTAALAAGCPAVCAFVNDDLSALTLEKLASAGVKFVALRCAGYNHVDLAVAGRLRIEVARVPAYSPHAVAEHAVALLLTLVRRTHKAYARVREGNFSLEGLLGYDINGLTTGVVGTGKIGEKFAAIMQGFGCRVLAYDPWPSESGRALGIEYTDLTDLLRLSDIVSLHCPLTPETRHLIRAETLALMRPGAVLLNTSRGALVDTESVIEAIKSGHLGALGLDVYEEEEELFFEDHSQSIIQDDTFSRLMTFPNVLVTAHQAFFTRNALEAIARTTLENLSNYEAGIRNENFVRILE